MKLSRRVSGLERHQYAPELNTLVLKSGQKVRVPGAVSIRDALAYLGRGQQVSHHSGMFVKYDFLLDGEVALENERKTFPSRDAAAEFIRANQGTCKIYVSPGVYAERTASMAIHCVKSANS